TSRTNNPVIKDVSFDLFNNHSYIVYVNNVDWKKMAQFGDSLVKGKGFQSVILFYDDSSCIPAFDENKSMYPFDCIPIAAYAVPFDSLFDSEGFLKTDFDTH